MKITKLEVVDVGYHDKTEQDYYLCIVSTDGIWKPSHLQDEIRRFVREEEITINSCIDIFGTDVTFRINKKLELSNGNFEVKIKNSFGSHIYPWVEILFDDINPI